MLKKKSKIFILKKDFDYEEDNYDRLKYMENYKNGCYTNKAKKNKSEYDYEEDAYEPRG